MDCDVRVTSLREILEVASNIENMLVESQGEITSEIEAALAIKDINLPAKVDSYGFVMDRMASVADFYKQKAKFFERLAKAADSVVERCEDNLKASMQTLRVDEILGNDIRFKLQKSNPSVVINNEDLVDKIYKNEKITVSIDKKRIAEDLKIGVPVAGAHLEQGFSLRKSANRLGSKG